MLKNWKNWCRLCGRCDYKNEGIVNEVESINDFLDIVNKHFTISLIPHDERLSSMCSSCTNFLTKLEGFEDKCLKTDQMFKDLLKTRRISNPGLQAIRSKYGIEESDENDPLGMDIDDPVAVKQELTERAQARGQKRKAGNKKLFVVSFKGDKSYLAVSYDGDEPDYSDFIDSVRTTFSVPDITLYCPNDIRITPDAFSCVFENNPPEYVVLKPGGTSKVNDPPVRSVVSRPVPERIDVLDFQELEKSCQDLIYKQTTPQIQMVSGSGMFQREVSSEESSNQDPQDDYQAMVTATVRKSSNTKQILKEIREVKEKLTAGLDDVKTSLQLMTNRVSTVDGANNQILMSVDKKIVFEQPHFLPFKTEEEFLAFNSEPKDSEKFILAVSYFTWLLRNTLHESVRIMIQKGLDDCFSRRVTFFGENHSIKFNESGLARAIFQALANGQDKFSMPNADEFRIAIQAAINASKQRDRNRNRQSQANKSGDYSRRDDTEDRKPRKLSGNMKFLEQ
ncbi:uncharacterized protein LOC129789365 [Lutzomyia longipalpis]|uniref:uncharacterized protein LOC129789365 n=1 Tax=Lutzomyia longipalpis TaxID=7200 RepID=UPI002483DCF4|nr:uncharacterized protein LOC129789365 [Lutzomyia longipalpis]